MTNARASWNVISTQSVYLYNCPHFEAASSKCPYSVKKSLFANILIPIPSLSPFALPEHELESSGSRAV